MAARKRTIAEFALIADCFLPLAAAEPGAFGLMDDAAVIDIEPGHRLVVTTDTIVAGVHYLASDAPADVAAKALAVNLSDLAAMGARPRAYTLAAAFARDMDERWVKRFAKGLAAEQADFGLALIGGDTVATPGPTTLTITALGTVREGRLLRRSGARPGDVVYVSGTIGDGALGLLAARGHLARLSVRHRRALVRRYRRPEPRIDIGLGLARFAHAAADVSDGLIADLGHICEASGTGAVLDLARIPLSKAARAAIETNPKLLAVAVTGGDDYELVFTVARGRAGSVARLSRRLGLPLTAIGRITRRRGASRRLGAGGGVRVLDPGGRRVEFAGDAGYRHSWKRPGKRRRRRLRRSKRRDHRSPGDGGRIR